jgi:hypothetical protein
MSTLLFAIHATGVGDEMHFIEVTIPKWEDYNPRKDLKATTWFRLQNTIIDDPSFFDFTHEELNFWIYVLCLASRKQSGTIKVMLAHAERVGRFSEQAIDSALKKLMILGTVEIVNDSRNVDVTRTSRGRNVDVTRTSRARNTTNERTNERDNIVAANADDRTGSIIEGIYKRYPRRKGGHNKPAGVKRLKRLSLTELERFDRAVANYAAYCTAEKKAGTEFVMQFSTFTSRWEEWADLTQPATKPILTPEEFLRQEDARRAAELAAALTPNDEHEEGPTHGIA